MNTGNDAVEIIKVSIEFAGNVLPIFLKIGANVTKDMARVIIAAMQCTEGNMSLHDLVKARGSELECVQILNDKREDIEKALTDRGVAYTVLPDLNTKDDYFEIMVHQTDLSRVNSLFDRFNLNGVEVLRKTTLGEYAANAEPEKKAEVIQKALEKNDKTPVISVNHQTQEKNPGWEDYAALSEKFKEADARYSYHKIDIPESDI